MSTKYPKQPIDVKAIRDAERAEIAARQAPAAPANPPANPPAK